MRKKLLLIGCSSKIARLFIQESYPTYELYGSIHGHDTKQDNLSYMCRLDLSNPADVSNFVSNLKSVVFDGIIFFASSYQPDATDQDVFRDQLHTDLQINALSTLQIAKGIALNKGSTVVFFGDSGLKRPKVGYTSYSISKSVLATLTRILAVELHETTRVLCFRLGPVYASADNPDKVVYYSKNLLQVDGPAAGLVSTLLFVLGESNLSMTGVNIDYDGGTYLKR